LTVEAERKVVGTAGGMSARPWDEGLVVAVHDGVVRLGVTANRAGVTSVRAVSMAEDARGRDAEGASIVS
jgi:hypothetical protein